MKRREFERKFKEIVEKYGAVDIVYNFDGEESVIPLVDTYYRKRKEVYFFISTNIHEMLYIGYANLDHIKKIKIPKGNFRG